MIKMMNIVLYVRRHQQVKWLYIYCIIYVYKIGLPNLFLKLNPKSREFSYNKEVGVLFNFNSKDFINDHLEQ